MVPYLGEDRLVDTSRSDLRRQRLCESWSMQVNVFELRLPICIFGAINSQIKSFTFLSLSPCVNFGSAISVSRPG